MEPIKTITADRLTAGLGLKPAHYEQALMNSADGLWFEVHTENYFIDGGPRLNSLRRIRERFPVSLHGVGGSLGGPSLPDPRHLSWVRRLVDLVNPTLVSEHAVWSQHASHYFAELLPMPRTRDAMQRLMDGVDCYQTAIRRKILLENPANYLSFKSELDEADFLLEVCKRTGCGLLLDVNNLYLSAHNCELDARDYILSLPSELVGEIHVAGHSPDEKYGHQLLIDNHATPVAEDVWQLLVFALEHLGPKPVLLERDGDIPEFHVLMEERQRAHKLVVAQRLNKQHFAKQRVLNSENRPNDALI